MFCFESSLFKNCLLHNQRFTINSYHLDYSWAPRWRNDKESTCQCRRPKRYKFDPWVRRFPGAGNGNPLQYSCLGNPMDRGAWRATVHGVVKSWAHWARAHTHTHTCNDSWVYSCYFCSFDRLCKALLLFRIYNQNFIFALSSHSRIRPEEQTPEYNAMVFLGWGVRVDFSLCACLCLYIVCNERELHLGLGN